MYTFLVIFFKLCSDEVSYVVILQKALNKQIKVTVPLNRLSVSQAQAVGYDTVGNRL